MSEAEFLTLLQNLKDAVPTPSYILQPDPDASCLQVERLRKAIVDLGNCPRSCGEGEGWKLYGNLPIEDAAGS